MVYMIKFSAVVFGCLVFSSSLSADTISDSDTALLEQASSYLNEIDTLQARFLQVDGRGGVAEPIIGAGARYAAGGRGG